MNEIFSHGTTSLSTLVAYFVALFIYKKWFSNGNDKSDKSRVDLQELLAADVALLTQLIETRFTQQHEDLKSIKAVVHENRVLSTWLKDVHNERTEAGGFKWWNDPEVTRMIREIEGRQKQLKTLLESRQLDAENSKREIVDAIRTNRTG